MRNEINTFFFFNGGTPNKALLWETFKAVVRGAFISQQAYVHKKKLAVSDILLKHISRLEAEHKDFR